MNFHSLPIKNIRKETEDAYSLIFDIAGDLSSTFQHKAGQYVTLRSEINGEDIRRPYSINSRPGDADFSVTIKKVKGGKMSHLLSTFKSGDTLLISEPEGHFTVVPEHSQKRSLYFIAAGSGITPIMSMLQSILEDEPKSVCYLLYGSRNEQEIIFRESLEKLSDKYSGQLFVKHVLSNPITTKASGLSGWLGKKETSWSGEKGRISPSVVSGFLEDYPGQKDKQFYICGPGDMIEKVEKHLMLEGFVSQQIHKEFFTPAAKKSASTSQSAEGTSRVEVILKGQQHQFDIPKNKIILDVLVENKLDPPYSCTSGACSTCIAKVTSGQVKMETCYALEDDEVAAGYILTCQAKAISEEVSLTYDV
ncbi:MAG: ferredoxin--NADP reductase [Saprospiraceae bacterium]|nr:ferredoxin--NADP reductase [Saprospiraceae bacterium]